MGNFRRQLRRSWKFIAIWLGLLLIALTQKGREFCESRQDSLCEDTLQFVATAKSFLVTYGAYIIATGATVLLIKLLLKLLNREDKTSEGFKNQPWHYDNKIIKLTAKVEKIFHDPLSETVKRKITDITRTITNNSDQRFRNSHKRFLISSPALRKGEFMLVEHNPKFGKISVKKGVWLSLQGEYIHRCSRKRTPFGSGFTFYGRIHSTYQPDGYIKSLGKKTPPFAERAVEVMPRSKEL